MRVVPLLLGAMALQMSGVTDIRSAEIFRWVDAAGVTHYSDEEPRDGSSFTTVEVIESTRPDYDPATDPYSIANQAKRINEAWSAIAQASASQRRQAAPTMPVTTEQRLEFGTRYYSPWFYSSLAPSRQRVDAGAGRRQLRALEGLQLSGQRPASINSGVHRERVQRSEALPITGAAPRRQH